MTAYGVVVGFEGDHHFLSNFHENEFTWRNDTYKTGEHAFQAAKSYAMKDPYITEMTEYHEKVRNAPTPSKAKYYGRSVNLNVPEWDAMKVGLMREIVHARFMTSERDMVGPLIATGAKMLVEANDWGDTFWGRCLNKDTGKWVGFNTLGSILMEERGWWSRGDEGRP